MEQATSHTTNSNACEKTLTYLDQQSVTKQKVSKYLDLVMSQDGHTQWLFDNIDLKKKKWKWETILRVRVN